MYSCFFSPPKQRAISNTVDLSPINDVTGWAETPPEVMGGAVTKQVGTGGQEARLSYSWEGWVAVTVNAIVFRGQQPAMPLAHLKSLPYLTNIC